MEEPDGHVCPNRDCHRIERQLVISQAEVVISQRLDGDEPAIAAILLALKDLPEAA